MALEVPETFLSVTPGKRAARPTEEARLFRLPPNHVLDLRDVARGVEESDVGVCCSYLVDSLSGAGADFDETALYDIERYVESALTADYLGELFGLRIRNWRERLLRCRRALRRMHERGETESVAVLHVAHGYPDPFVRAFPELDKFGPIASLVRYTDAVEEKRQELVSFEARAKARNFGDRYRRSTEDGGLRELAENDGYDPDEFANLIDLIERRDKRAFADRAISSGDALRSALAPFGEPPIVRRENEAVLSFEARKASRKEREAAAREKKEAFLVRAKIEATRVLERAEKRYHEAWLRTEK